VTPLVSSALRARELAYQARRSLRDRREIPGARRELIRLRAGKDVCWSEEDTHEPIVTVRIATKDRPELLVDRALASAVGQTYSNLDILVVGDGATPETVSAISKVRDPRVRFVNLSATTYPANHERRWKVIGHEPMNYALDNARGAWIAPLDDDDEFTSDHVETLLDSAVRRRLEFVYGDTAIRRDDGTWGVLGEWPPRYAGFTQGAVMYASALRFMKYDPTSWQVNEPADWNLWRRMLLAGVRMGHVPTVVYRYYPARHVPNV
jgi:glycosyltransferase involved in cell wall biosynthesis